jgi:uncharacterized membrane protein YhaH (DUF805 family)
MSYHGGRRRRASYWGAGVILSYCGLFAAVIFCAIGITEAAKGYLTDGVFCACAAGVSLVIAGLGMIAMIGERE